MSDSVEKEEAVFRSADMSLVQLYIPTEVAREVIYKVGQLNTVQFRDLNSKVTAFQRSFVKELRKLDNVERQYRLFKKELDLRNISIKLYPYEFSIPQQSDIDELIENSQILEDRVLQLRDSVETLYSNQNYLKQFRYTISAVDKFFHIQGDVVTSEENALLLELEEGHQGNVHSSSSSSSSSFIAGTINTDKIGVLQQILWRTLRGNMYYHSEALEEDEIYDAKHNSFVAKSSFIIFAHGSLIHERIKKICESLDAQVFNVEASRELRKDQLAKVNIKLTDLSTILTESQNALTSELIAIGQDLYKWWETIAREKAVYTTMNSCDYDGSRKTLICEGWTPTDSIQDLNQTILNDDQEAARGQSIPTIINVLTTNKVPPTCNRTNKFTYAFQAICDAYGVPRYKEINPGLPTIITFPFMFAIMFGDMGHGLIVLLAALAMVLNEKKLNAMKKDEIFDMAYSGRYILLLMGIFSMYTGFIYNDVFSRSMSFFSSGWKWPQHFKVGETIVAKSVGTYIFGLDSAWHGAENALLFSNSYKMKLSILMGFIHMTYSYFFALGNFIFFDSMIDIVGNFIPGLLFMQSIFGYLSLCIVYKWTVNWFEIQKQPPGLLNMLISMFLSPGQVDEQLFPGQSQVQVFLLLVALVCVPWLLLVKPLYLKRQLDKKSKNIASYSQLPNDEESGESNEETVHDDDEEEHEEHGFSDIMIHQVIHTIEFCLNCVSHTASYLRLWALSLAHAQLSTVLWSMTISKAFGLTGITGVIAVVFLFAMWFALSICILVVMEGTSAMLHSLRLHWVEMDNKRQSSVLGGARGDSSREVALNPYSTFYSQNREKPVKLQSLQTLQTLSSVPATLSSRARLWSNTLYLDPLASSL
ncbi:VPH1 [Candida oxycetoniae]|uniref:V-type proton ATPase subunit a n=1 Tax=Candida oxycetoniae TaxID=497107 RepID=A0AAI9WZ42_9ASCO|nr:VPH1 [Candida oxycetoniae]KAI3405515.2 VPH1 [Candida oxycetoniae]